MSDLLFRYQGIQERKARAESRSQYGQTVTLVAVSKTQSAHSIAELYSLGQRDFGENYAQELLEKVQNPLLKDLRDLRWHFIGHLQTNKVKLLLPFIAAVHSLDSVRLAEEISNRAQALQRQLDCFIEVNLNSEDSKSGIALSEVSELRKICSQLPGIRLQGLMSIPAPGASLKQLRADFSKLREAAKGLPNLSIGMSDDFETAIEEGSTHIRVGTALFGPREKISKP